MFLLNPGDWEAKSTNWTENQKNLWVQPTLPELQIISTYLQCNSSCLRDYFKSRWHIFRLSKLRRRGIRDWGQKLPKTWYQWEKLGKKRDKCTEAFQRSPCLWLNLLSPPQYFLKNRQLDGGGEGVLMWAIIKMNWKWSGQVRVLFSESQVCKTRLASSLTMDYEPSLYRLCPNNASVLVTI